MFESINLIWVGIGIGFLSLGLFVYLLTQLRVVVPTNMVHIVQSSKLSTPYGRGKAAGNTYYAWPSWVPKIGITVTLFPESIFQVKLENYEAYDSARLPFVIDVTAFFRVDNAETAAQRVASFAELNHDLLAVVQGSVRRILATNKLEDILQERGKFGLEFTAEVKLHIAEWGVLPVKTIEFMDIRDSSKGNVIANIMDKEKSRIEKESRIVVAENIREAQLKEIDAQRVVEVQKQDAEQQIGLRTAEKEQKVGIADEQAKQLIQEQAKITTEKDMEVKRVNDVKSADIAKDVAEIKAAQDKNVRTINAEADKSALIIQADAEKVSTQTKAEGQLFAAEKNATGIKVEGLAKADAEKAMLMAPVDTQIQLAKEIGSNEGYQKYLIQIESIKAGQSVGIEMAKAMQEAELKVFANSGDMQSGIASLGDAFSTKGGMNLSGMLATLAATDEGQGLVSKWFGGKGPDVIPPKA